MLNSDDPQLQIYAWLDSLSKTYPGVVTLIVGGESYEGRQIRGVKVSHRAGNPGVALEGGVFLYLTAHIGYVVSEDANN
jgi:hypothetical protein